MSDMLEQAIIDAAALRDAATKNAETLVLEKFSDEIRNAVDVILEQEAPTDMEDPLLSFDSDTPSEPSDQAGASPATPESSVMQHIPLAATSASDEVVEISLDQLIKEMRDFNEEMDSIESDFDISEGFPDLTGDGKVTQADILKGRGVDLKGDKKDKDGDDDKEEQNEVLDLDEDLDFIAEEEELDEMLDFLNEDEHDDDDEDDDDDAVKGPPIANPTSRRPPPNLAEDLDFLSEEEELDEEAELDEDLLEEIAEALTVDIHPVKSGWAGTPESQLQLAEEELLALEQDSKVREEKEALRKAVKKLDAVNEGVTNENKKLQSSLEEAKKVIEKLRDTVYVMKEKLDSTSVSNAKLLYQNKALNSDSLNERQKNKLVEAISHADTIEEAKIIFETLQSTVGSTSHKKQPKSLSEAVQKTSSMVLSSRSGGTGAARHNSDPTLDRWKFLAGIDKK